MQRLEIAQTIANALFRAEDQADQGLMAASALVSLMAETRLDHRLSAVLAAQAVSETTEAIRAFGEARARLVAAHAALEQAALDAGLGVNAGHDLNRDNLPAFVAAVKGLQEVSIGHAFMADALELGYSATVQAYLACLKK